MNFIPVIKLLRPHQWLKNLILFFPPFLSGAFLPLPLINQGGLPFAAFCCASSATYVFNDLIDRNRDRAHPEKCLRPIPAGKITVLRAAALCCVLAGSSIVLSLNLSQTFLTYIVVYLAVSSAYTLLLKDLPIIDVFCIALGFVLRLYGGGEAFSVQISDWLFLSVFLLAIFLSFGKRYSEKCSLGDKAGLHRRSLEEYPDGFLEAALYLSGSAVLVTYAIYAISKPPMVYTVPLCTFGLLRFLFRIKSGQSGDPTEALITDVPLMTVSFCWAVLVAWCVYQ